ncbi:MAG: DUF1007 family protein [Hyphomicrobium sp.]|nr:DUF1007 family protein [Hyphomicrobium sp.]
MMRKTGGRIMLDFGTFKMAAKRLAVVLLALVVLPQTASAHPHVWVEVRSTVLYDGGKITGFQHRWTFDDMYTAMAIQGLDKNRDGIYSREELQELAKVNIDGLREFGFFTVARLNGQALTLAEPKGYWLDHKDNVLALEFMLPLEAPIAADSEGFEFAVYDETFFIAFDLAKENPVKLSEGAPEGCRPVVGNSEKDLAELQRLNDAFGGQLTAGNANEGMGAGYSTVVALTCKAQG